MMEAAQSAFENITSLAYIVPLLMGIGIGFVIGIVPGLGGSTGLAITLPFVFGMDPFAGIALLIGLMSVNDTTVSFPSILIGVPGSGGSTATVLDGYPMAKKGEGARALGASFSASMLGGLLGAVALLIVVLGAQSVVPAMGSPELLMLTVLGMATIGVMVSGDAILGISSAVVGLMVGTIGGAPATPTYRYVYDQLYLYDGLTVVVVAIGIFAVPEIIAMLVARDPIAKGARLEGSVWDGFKETWTRHKSVVWRSSWLGTFAGAVPGLGGSVVDEMAYAATRAMAKDKSQFGKGDIRGVIAPEAANNAKEGGSLMPTLTLGIPGSSSTAILLGGLVLMGIAPGPPMLTDHLDITLTVIWTLAAANIIVTAICLGVARWIARVTLVPGRLLGPVLMIVFFAAAYQNMRDMGDIVAVLVIGLFGYFMKITGWPRVPFMVGFVLAPSLERYLHLSISRWGLEWLRRPGVLAIAFFLLLVTVGIPLRRRMRKGSDDEVKAFV